MKKLRIAVLLCAVATLAWADDDPAECMIGLKACEMLTSTNDLASEVHVDDDFLKTTLSAAIIRSKTVRAGDDSDPGLLLSLSTMQDAEDERFMYVLELVLVQWVGLQNGKSVWATTWERSMYGMCTKTGLRDEVRMATGELVDAFTVAWHKENPPKP